ncbi:MAG: hypothetical protein OXU35_01745 [Acidobacteriota bacterium]|nr:hypothetical protein [Gammaproteobacteria bacterium]MDE2971006.1 hypothetical protein [Acidobacteriota bacterium]
MTVHAVESQVDGETVIFDLDVASRTPSEGEPEEATQEDPRQVGTEAPAAGSTEESSGPEPSPAEEPGRPRRRPRPHLTLAEYVDLVRAMAEADTGRSADRPDGVSRWLARTTVLRKRQRAFGDGPALRRWLADRSMRFRETPLPA